MRSATRRRPLASPLLPSLPRQLYTNLPAEYASSLGDSGPSGFALVPANRSFKLASEVALMIVFLFQCYPRRLNEHASTLLPLMVQASSQWRRPGGPVVMAGQLLWPAAGLGWAGLRPPTPTPSPPPEQQVASIPGPALGEVPEGKTSVYNDFRMAQIKSLAFLTVIARSQNQQALMQPHKEAICGAIVRVMQTVPDVLTTRKELLIALRNILPTPFRWVLGRLGWALPACWGCRLLLRLLLSLLPVCLLWHQRRPPSTAADRRPPRALLLLLCASLFRPALLQKMDVLLDEQVLLGSRHVERAGLCCPALPSAAACRHAHVDTSWLKSSAPSPSRSCSRTCVEGLRPLAYSTLAELVASCKGELSYEQLARVVHIFTR